MSVRGFADVVASTVRRRGRRALRERVHHHLGEVENKGYAAARVSIEQLAQQGSASTRRAPRAKLHRHRKRGLREGEHFDELLVAQRARFVVATVDVGELALAHRVRLGRRLGSGFGFGERALSRHSRAPFLGRLGARNGCSSSRRALNPARIRWGLATRRRDLSHRAETHGLPSRVGPSGNFVCTFGATVSAGSHRQDSSADG